MGTNGNNNGKNQLANLQKLFDKGSLPLLAASERKSAAILIVDSDAGTRTSLRQTLSGLGFANVSDATDHVVALQKLEQRKFTHIIFEAKKTNMPPRDFLVAALEYDDEIIGIPSSFEPTVDDVFDLLVVGARGYLVKPFTEAGLDESIVMATKGEPISDAILYAKNRNEALASLIMTALDKLATTIRQSEQFETARRELPRNRLALRRAVDIGKTFAKGGEGLLLTAIEEFCLERSNGPATKLGRLRKRLPFKKGAPRKRGEAANAEEQGEKAPAPQPAPDPT